MSIRNAIIILGAALVVAVLLLTRFGFELPFMGEKVVAVEERPSEKPARPDEELLVRFKGQTMEQILAELTAGEVSSSEETESAPGSALLGALPLEAFPFPEGAKPVNEVSLSEFVAAIERGDLKRPGPVDRWGYHIASLALGKSADAIPEKLRMPVEFEEETENFPIRMAVHPTDLAGPLAVGDLDGNGFPEVVSHGGEKLWTLSGDGSLVEREGLPATGGGNRVSLVDFDRDEDLDLYISRPDGLPDSLLENDGEGRFRDRTIETGLLSFGDTLVAEWLDYDRDGFLDLAVGSRDRPFEIYRQVSAGKFEPVSWELDFWIPGPVTAIEAADLDRDGYCDLYLAIEGQPDQLLYAIPSSDPKRWRYLEKSKDIGLPLKSGRAIPETFDFDNDGDLDLLLAYPGGETKDFIAGLVKTEVSAGEGGESIRLFQNNGDGDFVEVTADSGLRCASPIEAVHVLDVDNDGFEDVLVITCDWAVNRAFWNRGGFRFRDISLISGLSHLDSPEQVHSLDLDDDGALDVLMSDARGRVKWLESEGPVFGWLHVKLSHAQPGTRVAVLARDNDWILQSLHRTTGTNPRVFIGLGDVDRVEEVRLYHPLDTEPAGVLQDLSPNQSIEIDLSNIKGTEGGAGTTASTN